MGRNPVVYVIERNGIYKIGFTTNIESRCVALFGRNEEYKIIYTERVRYGLTEEAFLHHCFEDKRIDLNDGQDGHTEWFTLGGEDIDRLKRLLSEYKEKIEAEIENPPILQYTDRTKYYKRLFPHERHYQRNLSLSQESHDILNALPEGGRSAYVDAAIREKAARGVA
jgi:carbohydrate-selective porin OprB